MNYSQELRRKIESREARVGVVGLGYVGLPLAVEFAQAGFTVTGIDLDQRKVDALNRGESYIQDVPTADVKELVDAGQLRATTDFSAVDTLDTINIAVPTPLRKTKDPDMSYIVNSCQEIAKHFHPGMLVILESTTYPGTTDELVLPMFETPDLKVGEDFFLCFSPERVDPGQPEFSDQEYSQGGRRNHAGVHRNRGAVLRPGARNRGPGQLDARRRDGEAARKYFPDDQHRSGERDRHDVRSHGNQRVGSDRRGGHQAVRVYAVLSRAGPGRTLHSDRSVLSVLETKQAGIEARFIELAGYINGQMPHFVVDKIQNALNDHTKPLKGSHVHILGVAYKRDIDDVRESPALDIIHLLQKRGAKVTYSDPFVPKLKADGVEMEAVCICEGLAKADCVVIVTDHKSFDYGRVVDQARLVVDTRNALKGRDSSKIVRL